MKGHKIAVTAGGSGIGRVIAEVFAKSGARVATCDVDPAFVTEGEGGDGAIRCWHADVGNPDSAGNFMAQAIRWLGSIDVLINNAGVSGPTKPVEEITDDEWRRTMEINVNGQFYCVRAAVPTMKNQRAGVILNISWTAGCIGMPRRSVYSTSKYAVRGFTDVLAVELGEQHRSTCVARSRTPCSWARRVLRFRRGRRDLRRRRNLEAPAPSDAETHDPHHRLVSHRHENPAYASDCRLHGSISTR